MRLCGVFSHAIVGQKDSVDGPHAYLAVPSICSTVHIGRLLLQAIDIKRHGSLDHPHGRSAVRFQAAFYKENRTVAQTVLLFLF